MKSYLLNISICVLIVVCIASCRQPIELDTDRIVTATNLPEITNVSPKIVWFGDNITITGKNFANVEKVQLGSIALESVRVVSPTEIRAVVPAFNSTFYYQQLSGRRLLTPLSLSTKLGTPSFKYPIAWAANRVQGFATLNGNPIDSILTVVTHVTQGSFGSPSYGETGQGFFTAPIIFSPSVQASVQEGTELIVRPFLSGYRFHPTESRVRITAIGGTELIVLGNPEFTATQVPVEQLPRVQTISPTMATVIGTAGTPITITTQGSNLSGIRQAFLQEDGLFSGTTFSPSKSQLRRNVSVEVNSDTQITIKFTESSSPFWGSIMRYYKLYLIGDNSSLLTTQRFTVRHN